MYRITGHKESSINTLVCLAGPECIALLLCYNQVKVSGKMGIK